MRFSRFFFTFRYPRGKYHRMSDYEPSDSDIEQVVDEARAAAGLGPAPRSPEQGIKDMDARIQELTAEKKRILDKLEEGSPAPAIKAALYDSLGTINNSLEEARQRKSAYETLLRGKN